jgi:hypothetical protein
LPALDMPVLDAVLPSSLPGILSVPPTLSPLAGYRALKPAPITPVASDCAHIKARRRAAQPDVYRASGGARTIRRFQRVAVPRPGARVYDGLSAARARATRGYWPSSAGATAEKAGARKAVGVVPAPTPLPPPPAPAVFAGKREQLDTLARAALLGVLVINGEDDATDADPWQPVLRIPCILLAQCICFDSTFIRAFNACSGSA